MLLRLARSLSIALPQCPNYRFHNLNKMTKRHSNIIDGKKLAENIKKRLQDFLDTHSNNIAEKPGIAFLLTNNRADSLLYVKQKLAAWNTLDINYFKYQYPTTIDEETILRKIDQLNDRDDVHGIMLQLPLPDNLAASTMRIINRIKPFKDVEGITDENMSKVFLESGHNINVPCTPAACMHILKKYNVELSGKFCVIANKSRIVGVPLAKLLMQENATVALCNTAKTPLEPIISKADVIFSAVGKYNSLDSKWIKEGAVVIDIGTNFINHHGSQKMVGDIAFKEVVRKVKWITPVPGGVGPVTVMMLTKNLIATWARCNNIPFELKDE